MSSTRDLIAIAKERTTKYSDSNDLTHEIELALGELFKTMPDAPVPWLAEYFVERSAALNLPCRVATSLSARTTFEILGGVAAVTRAVDVTFLRAISDVRVAHLLNGTKVDDIKSATVAALSKAVGATADARLPQEGALLSHSDESGEIFAAHLRHSLVDLGYATHEVDVTVAAFLSLGKEKSLFERLGGAPAVDVAVDKFYEKVVNDDRVKSFFKTVDMRKQRQKQKSFLTYAFGGPNNYTSKNMRDGHRYMVRDQGLNDMHFDTIVELLAGTLKELGIPDSDIAQVGAIAESVRDDVLCRGEGLEKKEQTLFERLGGAPAVDVAVDKFYEKVVNDDRVKSFFKTVDMRKQRQKQKSFLTYAFGGPNNYTSKNMRDGHRYMVRDQGLNDMHFDTIVELLAGTLKELGIPDSDIAQVGAIAESVRDDVLCKGEGLEKKEQTLFERLGGAPAVDVAVDKFYEKVVNDDRVKSFFKTVDMRKQRQKQKSFLTYAFGGPNNYTSKNMRDGHRYMVRDQGLNDMHFDTIVELLAGTLKELGIPDSDIAQVGAIAESVRDDVLCKGEGLEKKEQTLFERLGGAPAVDVAVDKFYEKVVNDDRVKSFFKTVDMRKQRQKQKSFLTYAFGGPNNYTSKNMRDGHRYMVRDQGLNDMHFDTIVELLAGTLKELGIPDSDIAQVGAIAESVRDDVLCKGEGLEKKEQTLFERLGGAPAVDVAVDKFYEKVVNDDRVKSFFKTVDMRKQRQKQKSFLTYAFGGPNNYTSKNMRDGHRYMVRDQGLNDMHFDTIVELLAGTLKELGIPDSDIAQVGAIAESVRDDVLCKGEGLEKKEKTLFERLGGAPAVDVAVDKFYEKVVNDDRVKSFFKTVDMRKQRQKQKSFLTYAFGGPNNYTSKNMRDGHRYMVRDQGLNDMHFDTIVELLAGTLKELGIPDSDIAQVGAIAESVRDDVLCKGEGLEKKERTLFERLGGAPAVDVAVDKFYEKVVNDDRVKSFFKTVDMRKQRQKQKSFLTYAFGGPNNYTSKNMRDGHRYMVRDQGLNDMHFDTIVELLAGTLKELGIPDSDIAQVGAIAESVRDDVLCKGEGLEKKEQTLFERLGGAPAVDVAVDKFYEKVVNDDRVKSFFKTVDMRKQRQKQKSFLTYAFGGPNNYTSKNMRDGHRYMVRDQGLNDMHFDTIVELLAGTLKELGIPDSDIAQVGAIAESVRDDVLCKGEGFGDAKPKANVKHTAKKVVRKVPAKKSK